MPNNGLKTIGDDVAFATRAAPATVGSRMLCQMVALVGIALLGCTVAPEPDAGPGVATASEVELELLTYNVAGLPQGISSGDPQTNIPQISPLLNAYDLVLVQEDFSYQQELRAEVTLPYQSYPKETSGILGDGLNRFGAHSFDLDVERQRWSECAGVLENDNDCLAEKGFSIAVHDLDGIPLTVINLHMDAGGEPADFAVRAVQIDQLVVAVAAVDGPVVVAGDTNIRPSRDDVDDAAALDRLIAEAELVDACRALSCDELDRIDRVLLRSGTGATVEALGYRLPDEFVDADGSPLSDHAPVAVELRVSPE